MIDSAALKRLREETGVSMALCKSALEETAGDHDKALAIIMQKAGISAAKKSDRTLGAGTIASYVHTNKRIGTLVELDSETDFVSGNEEFQTLARDIAMHISASEAADVAALMEEPFVKDPEKTIRSLIESAIQKFGEKIEIGRFVRFSVLQ